MGTETSRRLLEKMGEIVVALGSKDLDDFRARLSQGSVFLTNLGTCAAAIGRMSDEDFKALIDQLNDAEQEQALKQLGGLQSYIPMIGKGLIAYGHKMPQSQGGRPPSFKDHESVQRICDLVLDYIRKGYTEPEAKRFAAQKLSVSAQTIHRYWKRRTELATVVNPADLLRQVITGLSTSPLVIPTSPGDKEAAPEKPCTEANPLTSN
jgi:hypothetical protein